MKKAVSLGHLFQRADSSIRKSSVRPDYDEYRLNAAEFTRSLLTGGALDALISYVFYRSVPAFVLILPGLVPWMRLERKKAAERRKEQLKLQFKEMMIAVIAGLEAGYSVENAFMRAYPDMCLLYGSSAMISRELKWMTMELKNNARLEELLADLAARSHLREITDLSEVFAIAKRSGGDLAGILRSSAELINEKMEIKREITTLISAKKMEQSIMNMVPFAMILYIDASSPGFFSPLYHSLFGVIMMSVLLAVYAAAYLLSSKILNIQY